MAEDFFSSYLEYANGNEVPTFFHRWSIVAGLSAYLGRQYYFQHGHSVINPNLYCMLIGSPGTRKSTAIKLTKRLLRVTGYETFSPQKSSKEAFLEKLAAEHTKDAELVGSSFLDEPLFGSDGTTGKQPAECFVCPDEANNFFGVSNLEFLSILGELWDWDEPTSLYKYPLRTKKDIEIYQPTITILSGNTPTGFQTGFPPEIIGQGFFSRLILIYGEPNGKKIPFPLSPDPAKTEALASHLRAIKQTCIGQAKLGSQAKRLLETIYKSDLSVDDIRFESYKTRRFTQLLKLALIYSAARLSNEITERDVIAANTLLTHTERLMPKALGEFGKAKHSDVSHKIVNLIESDTRLWSFREIWKEVVNDLEKLTDLGQILGNLVTADRIQQSREPDGFLAKRRMIKEGVDGLTDYSMFTEEERKMTS